MADKSIAPRNGSGLWTNLLIESDTCENGEPDAPTAQKRDPHLSSLPERKRTLLSWLPLPLRCEISKHIDDFRELETLMLIGAKDGLSGEVRAHGYAVWVPPERHLEVKEKKRFAVWAGHDPHRLSFVYQFYRQAPGGRAGKIVSMAYAAAHGGHVADAFQDAPPLPKNIAAIFPCSGDLEKALRQHKASGKIRGEVMIECLPPELIDACEELPPHLCEVVDDYINLTGDTAAAGVLVNNIAEYQRWKREHASCDEHRALTSRVERAETCAARRLVLTDLDVTAPPPPWLPPCIKEIYVGGKKVALAYKIASPGIRVFSLECLEENLQRLGTPLAANERDCYFVQYQFAESDVGPSLYGGRTHNKRHRDLAEYRIGD